MRISILFFATLMATVLLCSRHVAAEEKHGSKVDMKQKLEYSQNILDGLVTENFDKILQGAKSLNQLGKQNWIENESSEYRTQNQVFWFTAGSLVISAEDKNIDGATLAYTQMTVSCVNCHKLIRGQ